MHDIVETEAKKGKNYLQIKQVIAHKCPEYYRLAKIERVDIKKHLSHSTIPLDQLRTVRRARKELMRQKKTAAEIQDGMMDSIGRILEIANSIKDSEIREMSPTQKVKIIETFSKLFQTDKKIAIDASKAKRDEFKFLEEMNIAATKRIGDRDEAQEKLLESGVECE